MKNELGDQKIVNNIFWVLTVTLLIFYLFYTFGKDSYVIHPESFL